MQWGNRRVFGVVVGAFLLAGTLAGCSSSGSLSSVDGQAIGQQALTFASSGGATPSDGSSAGSAGGGSGIATSCPDQLKEGLQAGLSANDALVDLNPDITGGVGVDPQLTEGFRPSCAFGIATSGRTVDELYFIGISNADAQEIAQRAVNDGFAAGTPTTITNGTQQVYASSTAKIAMDNLTIDNEPVLLIAG